MFWIIEKVSAFLSGFHSFAQFAADNVNGKYDR